MAKLKNSISGLLAATLSMTVLLNACSTNDVEPIVPGEGDNLVEISDEALGQYLYITASARTTSACPAARP